LNVGLLIDVRRVSKEQAQIGTSADENCRRIKKTAKHLLHRLPKSRIHHRIQPRIGETLSE
jgi:hypothetical protein